MQTAATEFPIVNGQLPNTDVYAPNGTTLISRKTNTGSFGEGFRAGVSAGYRFTPRLGVEMAFNYFTSKDKTMVKTVNRLVGAGPTFVTGKAEGKIAAFDLAPAIVLFLGEVKGFEPYTKVGVIVPVHGELTIETNRTYTNPAGTTNTYSKDVVKPNPTVGFMAALGTSYKLAKNISIFGELEYRNFTVHGKSKETEVYIENGNFTIGTYVDIEIPASRWTSMIPLNAVSIVDNNIWQIILWDWKELSTKIITLGLVFWQYIEVKETLDPNLALVISDTKNYDKEKMNIKVK